MYGLDSKTKILLLTLITITLASNGLADSNWTIEKKDSLSESVVSPQSNTIQVVNITADNSRDTTVSDYNDPAQLTPNLLTEDTNTSYLYNQTDGIQETLTHFDNGLWYAKFQPNQTKGNQIKYLANGTISDEDEENDLYDSGEEANHTETLTIGEYQVELQNNYDKQVKAGRQFEMEVAVTNTTSGNTVDDSEASVEVFFENDTDTTATTNIDNYENGVFFNSRVNYPDNADTKYIMHVKAYNGSIGQNLNGSTSRIIDIAPQVKGEISNFTAEDGCTAETMVENCEQDTNISIDYKITNAEAENVNLSIYGFNSSGRHRIQTMNLTQNGDIFSEEITVPDLNTSKYQKEIEFKLNATNNYRQDVDRHNVTLETFKTQDRSPPTTYIGQNYEFQIFLGKPYTLNNYGPERFNSIEVDITDSQGTQTGYFDKSNMTYSETSGVMEGTLLIDEENPTGSYTLQVTAENIYGEEKLLNSGFKVRDTDATFEVETDNQFQIERTTPQNFLIPVENLLQSQHTLETEVTELEDQITVTNETIDLESEEQDNIGIQIQLNELTDKTGEIKLIDSSTNYNQTTEIEINTPNCQKQITDLCSETDKVETSATAEENFTEIITLRHIGPEDSSVEYETAVEGEIGQHLTVENQNSSTELTGEKDIQLTFTPRSEGTFTGNVIFETSEQEESITIPVTLTYASGNSDQDDETQTPPNYTIDKEEIELGTVIQGETGTAQIQITNNGESTIESISTTSNSYTTNSDSLIIPSGQTKTITIIVQDVQSSSGIIQITGENTAGQQSKTLTVTANPIQNYAEKTSELNSRIRNLQSSTTQFQSNLTEASAKVSQIQTQWDSGNYEQARSTYQELDTTLKQIDAQSNTETQPSQESSGSILPILLITVILLLSVTFVLYTSYIPEEGDPLYSVLGENQQ